MPVTTLSETDGETEGSIGAAAVAKMEVLG